MRRSRSTPFARLRGSSIRRSAALVAVAALVVAPLAALAAAPAVAAPLPATYTATGSGDILTVSSTLATAPLVATDLIHASATADSGTTPRTVGTSSNLGAQVGPIGAELNSLTATAPPSSAVGPASVATASLATAPVSLSTGVLTGSAAANWAGDLACVPLGTPLSTATTSTAGASASLLGVPVLATGDASTTATTSLVAQSATNDTRSVQSTATGNVAGLNLLGAVSVSALQPTLTATATSGPAASATLTGSAVTLTYPGGSQTLNLGDTSLPITVTGVGSVTVHVASNADIAPSGGVFSTTFLTADITLLAGTGAVSVGVLPLSVSATAPVGGVECLAPVIAITAPAEGSTTTDSTPTISGTSNVPNGTVTVVIGGVTQTATTDADGNWTLDWPTELANGAQSVTASVSKGGTAATDTNAFTVAAPLPTITITAPGDGTTVADSTPAITGTSSVLSGTITLSIDGGAAVTVPTDASGNWTYTPSTPLAEGPHSVNATATTLAGTATDTAAFTVDVPAPVIAITAPAEGATTADATPLITGTSNVVSGPIQVSIDGASSVTVTTDAAGNWTYTPSAPLAEGAHSVTATATTAGGTASDTSAFTVDVAPAIAITSPADQSTTGDQTPEITGTSSVISGEISISIDGGAPITVPTDANGNWTYTPTVPLSNDVHDIVATATDAQGNTATDFVEFEVFVEGPLPVLDITAPADGSTVTDRTPEITGTSDVINGVVLVSINGAEPVEALTDGEGNWTLTPEANLPCGENLIESFAENEFGFTVVESAFTVSCQAGSGTPGGGALAQTGMALGSLVALALALLGSGALLRRWSIRQA